MKYYQKESITKNKIIKPPSIVRKEKQKILELENKLALLEKKSTLGYLPRLNLKPIPDR